MTKTITILLLILSLSVFAQNKNQISGQIKDYETNKNISFCSVVVLSQLDSLITGAITNDKGYFYIPVDRGSYKLAFSFIGCISDTINIGFVNKDHFFGVHKLDQNIELLKEVTVKASSRENTIDKDIQIITDDMRKRSTDTKEVLEKVPGISYDRYNNTIKVDNNSNIIILVNGVEKDQEYIKNLSPERLKKFEIIRDPGGRYGLEGYSAVINVILDKNYIGHDFFIYDQVLVDVDQKDKDYILPINDVYASYNYTYNKLNIYGTISNNRKQFAFASEAKTEYSNNSYIIESPPTTSPNLIIEQKAANYTLGADYYINPKHTISLETNMSNYPKKTNNSDRYYKTDVYENGIINDSYGFRTNNITQSDYLYNSLFYTGKLSNKDEIVASFTFSNYKEVYENKTYQEDVYERIETGNNNRNTTNLNVEYSHTFNDKVNSQIGYGNKWKKMDNKYNVNYNNIITEEEFLQTDLRHKLYGNITYKHNEKVSAKLGLAVETSSLDDEEQTHNYIIFQPLLDLKYKLSKSVNLKFKYRSQSNYPSMSQTNPFELQLDPNTVSVGNPNLAPAVTHKISLKANIMNGLISFKPYYDFSNNYIAQIGELRPDNIYEFTYDNVGFYEERGIQTNFTIPFGKLFVWQNSVSIYNSKIKYEGNTNNITDWRANSNLVFTGMKKGGMVLLNYLRGNNKYITATGYERRENDYWLLVVQQPFFKKKLTVMLGYILPVDFGVYPYHETYTKIDGYEKLQTIDIGFIENMFFFKLSYRFNKGKNKKIEKNIDIEEEGSGGLF